MNFDELSASCQDRDISLSDPVDQHDYGRCRNWKRETDNPLWDVQGEYLDMPTCDQDQCPLMPKTENISCV